MEESYVYAGTKKLRRGYTTGSCATAAAKAAAEALFTGRDVALAEITAPGGERLRLDIVRCERRGEACLCGVIKDGGDDPDVTSGLEVRAEVSLAESGIEILGGEGVGVVTKPGLDQPVGAAAINSVPRRTIARVLEEAAETYEYRGGFRVAISVPGGEGIAKKTFNPRIGIVGGVSIIGTTGIVEPMSNSAVVGTIRAEANIRKAEGRKTLVLAVGNYAEKFVSENLPALAEQFVTCGNFIGDAVDIGITLGFKDILVCGHIGKMVKLGSGITNTHSSCADGRMETLMACGVMAGVDIAELQRLDGCATVDAALDILRESGSDKRVLEVLAGRVHAYLQARAKGEARVGAVVFSFKNDTFLKTEYADEIIALTEG